MTFRKGLSSFVIIFVQACSTTNPTSMPDGYPNTPETSNKRFGFAQLYLGLDSQYIPEGQTWYLDESNTPTKTAIPARLTPRFVIGAFHFWGKIDLSVNLQLPSITLSKHDNLDTTISHGSNIGIGVKYFPWPVKPDSLLPFVGANLVTNISYAQKSKGSSDEMQSVSTKWATPLTVGLAYASPLGFFEAGIQYIHDRSFDFYLDRQRRAEVTLPHYSAWLGYKAVVDTTVEGDPTVTELGEAKDGLELAIGPSSLTTYFVEPKSDQRTPYIDERSRDNATLYPEMGIGYYFAKKEAHLGLAYRNIDTDAQMLSLEKRLNRQSIALEAYHFLFDYHGFVPFIGPNIAYENYHYQEFDQGVQIAKKEDHRVVPGITFGWDIRPTNIEAIILRTNLRYNFTPDLDIQVRGVSDRVRLRQMEFNWIEVVWYPERVYH